MMIRVALLLATLLRISLAGGTAVPLARSAKLAEVISLRLDEGFNGSTNFRAIEEQYRNEDFSFTKWDIATLVDQLAEDIEQKLTRATTSLRNLRTKVHQVYRGAYNSNNGNYLDDTSRDSSQLKSKMDRMLYSAQHNQDVSLKDTVYSTPADVSVTETKVRNDILWTNNLLSEFETNFKAEPEILIWQYFCTENGVLRLYPATPDIAQARGTYDYDCRFQPWYIEGDGCSRDIIIAFDLSGSMIGWPLKMANNTASQILKLLSDNDFLGFIGIAEKPIYLRDSNNQTITTLSRATEKVKYDIHRQIQGIAPEDEADFHGGINAAFDMFEKGAKEGRSAKCQKILIVFSDGTKQNCKEIFDRRNPAKDVQVFTFACGKPRTTTSGLVEMACSNRGNFLQVGELTDVNTKTFEFFNLINRNSNNDRNNFTPKWSNAYVEVSKAGHIMGRTNLLETDEEDTDKRMILTVSAPTFYQENKTGIVGLDVKIGELVKKVKQLNKAGLYAVIVNNRGNLVYHPRLGPLPDIEYTYTARFAEFEQCTGPISSSDIERTIVTATAPGMVEAECLYYYSSNLERGREFYTRLQYHYTPVGEFPFNLVLVIPRAFSYQIESSRSLANATGRIRAVLAERTSRMSVSGWFSGEVVTARDRDRFDLFVVNETATHYLIVNDMTFKSWATSQDQVAPVLLYTNAGLLLFNYAGWLQQLQNSEHFVENSRLIASLEGGVRLIVGPNRSSSAFPGQDAWLITRNVVIRRGFTPIIPAVVGSEITWEDQWQKIFEIGLGGGKELKQIQSFLIDNKGFIILIHPLSDTGGNRGKHIADVFPELMRRMILNLRFSLTTFKDCLHTCRKKAEHESGAGSLSSGILLLYNMLTLSTSHSQLGSTISLKREDRFYRCCKDFRIYNLNYSLGDKSHVITCPSCNKEFHVAPIKNTNLLLVNDMNPDCVCPRAREIDKLNGFNEASIYNVSFGRLSYKPLPCTEDVNISTECSSCEAMGFSSLILLLICANLLIIM